MDDGPWRLVWRRKYSGLSTLAGGFARQRDCLSRNGYSVKIFDVGPAALSAPVACADQAVQTQLRDQYPRASLCRGAAKRRSRACGSFRLMRTVI